MADFNFDGSGGVEVDGLAEPITTYNFSSSGGVEASGSAELIVEYKFSSSGGVEVSGNGNSSREVNFEASGGAEVSGSASIVVDNVIYGSGGVVVSGDSTDQTTYFVNGSGGAVAGGDAYEVRIVPIFGSGGAIAGGASSSYIIFNPTTSGGVEVSGNSTDIILAYASLSIPLLFDLGQLPVYAYRVVGYCSKLDCSDAPFTDPSNNCKNQVINYILARNLSDICDQLASYDFIFRVKAVYKYSRALFGFNYLQDVRNDLVDPNCNKYIDVTDDFCTQAQCFDFCIANNSIFLAKGIFSAAIYNPKKSYGSLKLTGGYALTKSSVYTYVSQGNINLNGGASFNGNNLIPNTVYAGTGAINLSGSITTNSSFKGEYNFTAYVDFNFDAVSVDLTGYNGLPLVGEEVNPVTNICGCFRLLNYVNFESNLFTKSSILSYFLFRNKISPEKTYRLYYNPATKTFYNAIKFEGIGNLQNETESWNIIVELACTDQVTLSNESLWNYSFFIQRKTYKNNILTNNLETRFYVYIPKHLIYNNSSLLEFDFQIDMKNLVIYRRFKDIVFDLQPRIIKDNIKLFSSGEWINDPFLNVYIFSISNAYSNIFKPDRNSTKIDISSLLNSP